MEDSTHPLATRDQFLSGGIERRYAETTLPASGLRVRVRSLSELERSRYELAIRDREGKLVRARQLDQRARLICLCVVDEAGRPLLCDADIETVQGLDGLDQGALFDFCFDHCFGRRDQEAAVKN